MFDLFAHAAAPAAERFLREKMPGVNERSFFTETVAVEARGRVQRW